MSGRLSLEEIEQILEMVEKGVPRNRIAVITGRPVSTIYKLVTEYGMNEGKSKVALRIECEKARWLRQNWNWLPPEEQHVANKTVATKKKKKRKSNFRTPYNFPGKESHY